MTPDVLLVVCGSTWSGASAGACGCAGPCSTWWPRCVRGARGQLGGHGGDAALTPPGKPPRRRARVLPGSGASGARRERCFECKPSKKCLARPSFFFFFLGSAVPRRGHSLGARGVTRSVPAVSPAVTPSSPFLTLMTPGPCVSHLLTCLHSSSTRVCMTALQTCVWQFLSSVFDFFKQVSSSSHELKLHSRKY